MRGSSRRSPLVHWLPPTVAALLIHGATLSLALSPRASEATSSQQTSTELQTQEFELADSEAETVPVWSSPETPVSSAAPVSKSASSHRRWAPQLPAVPVHAVPVHTAPTGAAPKAALVAAPPSPGSEPSTWAEPAPLAANSAPNASLTAQGLAPNVGSDNLGVTGETRSGRDSAPPTALPALSTKPRLISSGAACHGVLGTVVEAPTKVTLVLQVATDGTASPTAVRAVSGQHLPELTVAAQRCAQRLRFLPARSANGQLVVASSTVKLTFSNHPSPRLPGFARAASTARRRGAI